ncbi:oxidoreductase, short chain dehydrogenase/reductase family [Synechococcus sp. PCC 7335]|uniref:SDR family NAD(P)-dependent oxidoreductase n=1 Tax=Synechococcus sp. (strain ATCC 29403 / PCC 7335) TaxID=91464 RepID=UPI00017EC48D|nr:SDR family NAD(P)-dependent oxidoreductase [Synechococcus sp. PCC 7335]EDX82391.1 oxidoreductase, short chain dehydrogenase/reductase family [Synechococcus sp. PCC 7335]
MVKQQRTALITGGNRGIGFAIAQALAEKFDYHVIIGSRDVSHGKEAADSINGEVSIVEIDLANRQKLSQQIKTITDIYPSIDVLINSAGIYPPGKVLDIDIDTVEDALSIHVIGPWMLVQALVPAMANSGYGRVVNVSSGGGSFASGLAPSYAAYGVSKAGMNALTLQLAKTVPPSIKVNSMCPGWVRTRMGGEGASRSPKEGADTAVWLATLPEDGPTGGFFRDRKPIEW